MTVPIQKIILKKVIKVKMIENKSRDIVITG